MTISSTTVRNQYNGDGSTVNFTYQFRIIQAEDIRVVVTSTTGIDSVKVLGVDYSVSGVAAALGGTVTMTAAPAAGTRITLSRNAQALQEEHYVENDPFPAASHEMALDRVTTVTQSALEQTSRALQVPFGTNMSTFSNLLPALTADVAGFSVTVKNDYSGFEYSDISGSTAGDVTGPGSSTDNAIVRFSGTTGKILKNSTPTITDQGAIELRPYGAGAGQTGEVRFYELTANGTNYVAFKAPDNKVGDNTYTLPTGDGSAGFVLSTNGSGTLSWVTNNTGPGIVWTNVGSPTAMSANNGYLTSSGSTLVLSLPATAAVGDIFEVTAISGGWQIIQNGGQQIRMGDTLTTVGVTGSLTGAEAGDSVRLLCTATNTNFQVLSSFGNLILS